MSEFTEGPWCTGSYDPRFIFDSIGRNIAFLEIIEDETLANARLIAAAPLTYEALRDAVNCIENLLARLNGIDSDNSESLLRDYARGTVVNAQAALAWAGGE